MLIKAIALDDICSVLVDAAKKKNFYSLGKTAGDDMDRIDYEFWGMVKLMKTLDPSFELNPFDLYEYYPTGSYYDKFLIEGIEVDGKKYPVNTLEEILSLIETHKKFMEYSGK